MKMSGCLSGDVASIGDEPVGKVICEQVIPFDAVPKELWMKFADKAEYDATGAGNLGSILKQSEGNDTVIIYLEKERAKKILPPDWNVLCK